MERMSLKFTLVIGRGLLGHLHFCLALLGLIASSNSTNEGFNPSLAFYPPLHPPHHPPTCHPLCHTISDITVVLKEAAQNPAA